MKQQGVLLLEVLLALLLFSVVIIACIRQQLFISRRINLMNHQMIAFQVLEKAQIWHWQGKTNLSFLLDNLPLSDAKLDVSRTPNQFLTLKINWYEAKEKKTKSLTEFAYR